MARDLGLLEVSNVFVNFRRDAGHFRIGAVLIIWALQGCVRLEITILALIRAV
jgi:hypothetical protein